MHRLDSILHGKSKLLDKVSTTDGDRLLQEYHINLEVLNEELQR